MCICSFFFFHSHWRCVCLYECIRLCFHCVTTGRTVYFFENVQQGHAEFGRDLMFGPLSTRWTWPPLTGEKKMEKVHADKLLRSSATVKKEMKQGLFHMSPAQTWLHLLSEEFPQFTWWIEERPVPLTGDVWRLLLKQFSSPREEKDQRHEWKEEQTSPLTE